MKTTKSLTLSCLAVGVLFAACTKNPELGDPYKAPAKACAEVQCTQDSHCGGGLHCLGGSCTECASDDHCTAPGMGACRLGSCMCSEDSACIDAGAGRACVSGLCVPCRTNADCGPDAPVCYAGGTASAFCGCAQTDTSTPTGDDGCEGVGPETCADNGSCIACAQDSHCAAPAPKCHAANTADAFCGCATGMDCPMGESCVDGTCGEVTCSEDGDCSGTTPTCYSAGTFDSYCGCGADSDCMDGKCMDGECVPISCKSNADCTTPGNGKCWNPGTISSYCGCDPAKVAEDCDGFGSECRDGFCSCKDVGECGGVLTSTIATTYAICL